MSTIAPDRDAAVAEVTTDGLEQELLALEALVGQARARQVTLLREVDERQVPGGDGCASLKEWVTGRLDVHPITGGELAFLAKAEWVDDGLQPGDVSFDRAAATARLRCAGADDATVERSKGVGVQQVRRLVSHHRLHTRRDEARAFEDRHLYAQFSLDFTWVQLRGGLPGVAGERVLAGLDERADRLIDAKEAHRPALPQRRADALVSWAMDELDGGPPAETVEDPSMRSHRMHGAVFVDASLAAPSHGQAGASTRNGLRVGPRTLEEILCSGTVDVTVVGDGALHRVGSSSTAIPPRVRRFVLHRDQGCTADGCMSRYRLEPHHIVPRSKGGSHDPSNLTMLCWFHHHVVVHQRGYGIDPESPPGRRRFIRPDRAPPSR